MHRSPICTYWNTVRRRKENTPVFQEFASHLQVTSEINCAWRSRGRKMFSVEAKRVEVADYAAWAIQLRENNLLYWGGMKYCGFDWKNNRKKKRSPRLLIIKTVSELYLYDFPGMNAIMSKWMGAKGTQTQKRVWTGKKNVKGVCCQF